MTRLELPGGRPVRFLLVGALNSVFGFAAFSMLVLLTGSNLMGVLGGNVAGLAFNFLTHGGLVFRQLALRNFPRFAGCYAAMIAVNTVLLGWLGPLLDNTYAAQALLTIPLALMSYVLMSRWVFRDRSTPAA